MAPKSVFTRMCGELSRSVLPRLRAAGFDPPPAPFSRDTLSYPFTRLAPQGGTHVLEILFTKYRKPEFYVRLYVAPPSGLSTLVEQGGSLVLGSLSSSRLRWPFPVRPFRAGPTRAQRLLGRGGDRIQRAVESFLSLVPEVEGWWAKQKRTRHITVSRLTYPGAQRGEEPAR